MKIDRIPDNIIPKKRDSTRVEVESDLDKIIKRHKEIIHEPTRNKLKIVYSKLYNKYSTRYNLAPKYHHQYMQFVRQRGI